MGIFHSCVQELRSWIFTLIVPVTPLSFCLFVSFVLLPKQKSGGNCKDSPILFQCMKHQMFLFQEAEYIYLSMCVCMHSLMGCRLFIPNQTIILLLILFRCCNNTAWYMCALWLCGVYLFLYSVLVLPHEFHHPWSITVWYFSLFLGTFLGCVVCTSAVVKCLWCEFDPSEDVRVVCTCYLLTFSGFGNSVPCACVSVTLLFWEALAWQLLFSCEAEIPFLWRREEWVWL